MIQILSVVANAILNDTVCRYLIVVVLGIFFLLPLLITWKQWKRGDDAKFLWFTWTVNPHRLAFQQRMQEAAKEFEKLSQLTDQKRLTLEVIDSIIRELKEIKFISDIVEFENRKMKLYNFIVTSISNLLTSKPGNYHRVGILEPCSDLKYLRLTYGPSYSGSALSGFQLEIDDSFAGWVFKKGVKRVTDNVKADPLFKTHPKSTKEYNSLGCFPIVVEGKTIAVLNIDGYYPDSFTKDDETYLEYFANIIGLVYQYLGSK